MNPSEIRKPPARAMASRSGTAQWCSSRRRAAAEALLALDAEADERADLAPELDRLLLREVAPVLDLDVAHGVL